MYYHKSNEPNILVVIFVILVIGLVVYTVYDRCTGTTKLILAVVSDKVVKVETSTTTDEDGYTHYSTTTYHFVYFHRNDGKSDRIDVGSWAFGKYSVSQQIVCNYTIGGSSGMEYLCGIDIYEGAEKL